MSGELTKFQVVVAFDNHRVGDVIAPTGLHRDRLLRLKFIAPLVRPCALLDPVDAQRQPLKKARR